MILIFTYPSPLIDDEYAEFLQAILDFLIIIFSYYTMCIKFSMFLYIVKLLYYSYSLFVYGVNVSKNRPRNINVFVVYTVKLFNNSYEYTTDARLSK